MKLPDSRERGVERHPCDTPVEEVEADIYEGYIAYLSEVAEGLWPAVTLSTALTFAEYRCDYWRDALPDLIVGNY